MEIYTINVSQIKYKDPEKIYIESKQSSFLLTFNKEREELVELNSNIEPVFYEKKEYDNLIKDSKNPLEPSWKRRILYQTTPRGNVVMYYDSYKMGFAYYSDTQSISYDILNSIAMKYVIMFRCLDFFVDETVLPESHCSPFIKIHFTEEKKIKSNEGEKYKPPNIRDPHFIKFKNYNDSASKVIPSKEKGEDTRESQKERMKNKFVHLGKICNFHFSQPFPKKRRILAPFKSNLLESIDKDTDAQLERLSYADFKRKQNNAT